MRRRSFIRSSTLTLSALAILSNRSLAGMLKDPAWKIKMLTKEIGVFTEKGGTILFMRSNEGIVVVDSQFPEQSQHLIDELKKDGEKPFRLLINTHHHGDHSSGNIAFKGLVPHVLAHANSKANQQKTAVEKNNEDQQLYPDQTYTDVWSETIGQEKVSLHYFGAGHTNGDSLVHFQHANIVHMGDLVFNRRHPFVDRSAGASISNWIKVLDKAGTTFTKKTTFVCGHAAEGYDIIATGEDLKLFRNYLEKHCSLLKVESRQAKQKRRLPRQPLSPAPCNGRVMAQKGLLEQRTMNLL